MRYLLVILTFYISSNVIADSAVNSLAVTQLLKQYQLKAKVTFSKKTGKELWTKKYSATTTNNFRSCSTCHTDNLTVTGLHVKTKKNIKPLAPSVNKKRLIKTKNIKKWFKRNCKWTLGRECTAEEKGHLLTFIQSQ